MKKLKEKEQKEDSDESAKAAIAKARDEAAKSKFDENIRALFVLVAR